MSNPRHPCFAGATSVGPAVLSRPVPARAGAAGRTAPPATSARNWAVGVSLVGLALWALLLLQLGRNLAPPALF